MSSSSQQQMLARQCKLFKGIAPEDVAKIFAHGNTVRMAKGQVIFYQGATGNTMYVVLGGKVNLYDGKKPVASLGPGDTFGEMALINNEPRSLSAAAAEDCMLFVMTETFFQRLMTKRVAIQILLNVVGTLSQRLRDTNARFAKIQGRLAEFEASASPNSDAPEQ